MLNKDSHKVIGHIIANCILFSYVQGGRGGGRIAVLGNWSG